MSCYRPLTAWHAPGGISFDRSKSFGLEIELPCGRCIGCRLEKAKEWALRCHHEASLTPHNNSFVTLTYSDENLPPHGELDHSHFQKFMKRLRKKYGANIRYYMCGEYGEETHRPHYHAILFNHTFEDKELVNIRRGNRVYVSQTLDQLWKLGSTEIGSVTFQSAGYVARYIIKKQAGTDQECFERYAIVDPDTGEMKSKKLEYTSMSLKPGIGQKWYEQNKTDLFPHDFAVLPDGRETSVPEYYRRLLKAENPKMFNELRKRRIEKARNNPDNNPSRLAAREQCKASKIKRLKREL